MNQGTQGYNLTKKTEGRKSRDTVSLMTYTGEIFIVSCVFFLIVQSYTVICTHVPGLQNSIEHLES
jgi:hypothetical protein